MIYLGDTGVCTAPSRSMEYSRSLDYVQFVIAYLPSQLYYNTTSMPIGLFISVVISGIRPA